MSGLMDNFFLVLNTSSEPEITSWLTQQATGKLSGVPERGDVLCQQDGERHSQS